MTVPEVLFLTSKVRLHCDRIHSSAIAAGVYTFPDLKGQAPLRQELWKHENPVMGQLFLTSKVRLHCDLGVAPVTMEYPIFS